MKRSCITTTAAYRSRLDIGLWYTRMHRFLYGLLVYNSVFETCESIREKEWVVKRFEMLVEQLFIGSN